jgi:hypothetical protein
LQAQSLDGVWKSEGYGSVVEVQGYRAELSVTAEHEPPTWTRADPKRLNAISCLTWKRGSDWLLGGS